MDCQITWASQYIKQKGGGGVSILSVEGKREQSLYEQLKAIWSECFSDSEDYIDFFLKHRFNPADTLVAVYGGQVVGVYYMLPVRIVAESKEIPALFGYALGVLRQYRGQNIGASMHHFLLKHCSDNNYAFLFHPANEKLVKYYRSLGITQTGYIKKAEYTYHELQDNPIIILTDITSNEYARLRNAFLQSEAYVRWDDAAIDYAISENRFSGGFCKKLCYKTEEYAIFGKFEENNLTINEALIPECMLTEVLKELATYYGSGKVTVYLSAGSKADGVKHPWIMGSQTEILHKLYCNLLLN